MKRIAVVPGSFDPVTHGHLDVIERAAELFDEVRVLVMHNPSKKALFSAADRATLLREAIDAEGFPGDFVIDVFTDGLLADYCTRVGAQVLVKGVRSQVDLSYETPMAYFNRNLAGVETVFVVSDPAHALISSTLVREVYSLGGDISPYVPAVVIAHLKGQL